MPSTLLFAFYFILLSLVLARSGKIRRAGIEPKLLLAAFAFKVTLGCAYGYIFLKMYGGDDTWAFHRESLSEYQLLMTNPAGFFKEFLPASAFNHANGTLQGIQYYLNDLENFFMWKPLAIFDLFSRGNYYINALFFDFITFFGPLYLFKLLSPVFNHKKTVLVIALFFIPATTFWLSGIRAEGLLLLFMSVLLFYSFKYHLTGKRRYAIFALLGATGMFIFRFQYLLVLLPAFIGWNLSIKKPGKAVYYFFITYTLSAILFFISPLISQKHNLPAVVAERQKGFFELQGNTRFELDSLQPTIGGFVHLLPQSFANGFLRPFPWEAKGPLQTLTALSGCGFFLLFLLTLFYREKKHGVPDIRPLLLLFVFYGISQVLLIGYIVPFPGAIVRYAAIPFFFIDLALFLLVDWNRILFKLKLSDIY